MKTITHSKPSITDDEVDALVAQIQSGMVAEGATTTAFEAAFANCLCLPHAIAVGTGSQALLLALTALDLRPGDAVVLPDYTCVEILAVICHLGLQPIIVDVQEDYLLSVEAAFAAMNDSVKAIVFPYTMGIFRDISPTATTRSADHRRLRKLYRPGSPPSRGHYRRYCHVFFWGNEAVDGWRGRNGRHSFR